LSALLSAVALALTLAACGSGASAGPGDAPGSRDTSASPLTADVSVTAAAGAAAVLPKGEVVRVLLPAGATSAGGVVKYSVSPSESAVLTPVGGAPGYFAATAAGTAKVAVTRTPSCSPGVACPAYIIEVGAVSVTVTG